MRCSLCDGEWKEMVDSMACGHEFNGCALSGVAVLCDDIPKINAAIEAAREDTRKPEECKNRVLELRDLEDGERHFCEISGSSPELMCPCAAWEKKEKV